MSKTAYEFIEPFDKILKECENFLILTRDSALQKSACTRLQTMLADCGALKSKLVAARHEDAANLLLGFECVANCLIAELTMWILLKEEKPDEAWDNLVSAQMAAADAARAHEAFAHLEIQAHRLEE